MSDAAEVISWSLDGALARIGIRRPDKRNALATRHWAAIEAALDAVAASSAQVLVLAGVPGAFSAGADIDELGQLLASPEAFAANNAQVQRTQLKLQRLPQTTLAVIDGVCVGGGLGLALACDLRIAADDAVVGMPEVKVGIPSVIHAALMPAQIGATRAAWLLLAGENIPATKAEQWGLINECVPRDQLDARILQIAAGLAEIGPVVLRQQKRLLRRWERMTVDAAIDDSIAEFGEAFKTGEPQHHMNAFLERKSKRS